MRRSTTSRRAARTAVAILGLAAPLSAVAVLTAPASALSLPLLGGGARTASPAWAPAETATITPGAQVESPSGQCTANFVFYAPADDGPDPYDVFVGTAAHCMGTGAATDTNGCDAGSLPLGTTFAVQGASQPGTAVYSSWLAMQGVDERDPGACAANDFLLIELAEADEAGVNPSVPGFGGPTGLAPPPPAGATVYAYGNSSLRFGLVPAKAGISLGQTNGGWTTDVYTVSPGVPGDSGSGYVDAQGGAFGVVSTLALAPLPASNQVSSLDRMLAYAAARGTAVTLASGTEAFDPLAGLLQPAT